MPWREYVEGAHLLGKLGRGAELPKIWPAPPVVSGDGCVNGLVLAAWVGAAHGLEPRGSVGRCDVVDGANSISG